MSIRIKYSAPELIDLSLQSAKGDCTSGTNITVGDCANGTENDNDCLSGNNAYAGFCEPSGSAAGITCDAVGTGVA